MKDTMTESRTRSIIKTLSWRIVATLITMIVAFVITRKPDIALEIGIADTLIKLVAFYGHERAWIRLRFGRKQTLEYEI